MEYEIKLVGDKAHIYTPYNPEFVRRVKLAGGHWSPTSKCWCVEADGVDSIRAIMREVYGRDDSVQTDLVTVRVTVSKELIEWHKSVVLMGRSVATATGRDSGARGGDGVYYLSGEPHSGGSVKNWTTVVPAGSVIEMHNVPRALVLDDPEGRYTVEILDKAPVNKIALTEEREKLLARIAEIDALLQAPNA